MASKKLIVLGSVNADHVLQVDSFPRPGETVTGHGYKVLPGGKGANQAVAAARLGGEVGFVACVGDDDFGSRMIKAFQDTGCKTRHPLGLPCAARSEEHINETVIITFRTIETATHFSLT